MKKTYLILIVALAALFSCNKSGNTPVPVIGDDSGCIMRVHTSPADSAVSTADHQAAVQLMQQAGINCSNYKVLFVNRDTFIKDTLFVSVQNQQYVNGLPVFFYNPSYSFTNGRLTSQSGDTITRSIALDTIPTLRITQVRKLFVTALLSQKMSSLTAYKDSCLAAEFGYYNANRNNGGRPLNLVKVWYIHPADADMPSAIYTETGEALEFSSGIVVF